MGVQNLYELEHKHFPFNKMGEVRSRVFSTKNGKRRAGEDTQGGLGWIYMDGWMDGRMKAFTHHHGRDIQHL